MKRRIWKAAEVFCLSAALCIGVAGCSPKEHGQQGMEAGDSSGTTDLHEKTTDLHEEMTDLHEEMTDSSAEWDNEAQGSSNMSEEDKEEGIFYGGANLSGRVVDFSDTGFTITPRSMVINGDGTMEGGIAAPGYESEETNIHIRYSENVVFQVIYFSMGAQAETSREDTDKSSIKKDTDVNIFGTCQDEKNWIADKVVITRWQ